MSFWLVVWLSLVEGVTEFLPISSTGHMILLSTFLGIAENAFVKNFEVIIQFGAILSILFLYRERFRWNFLFYKKILVACLPTLVMGFLLKKSVDVWLGSASIVAWALILGGVVLIASDFFFKDRLKKGLAIESLTLKQCALIGLIQSLALIPGVSRSGASILAGMGLGLSKKESAEFSFFLAVPTMMAATGYKLFKIAPTITQEEIGFLILGSVLSFIFAALAVRFFVQWISKHGFQLFGYYRIILGIIILYVLSSQAITT